MPTAGSKLHGRGISKTFRLPTPSWLRASVRQQRVLQGVDLDLHAGESVGLIGRTGAGKSTLARVLAGLCPPDAGSVHLEGEDLFSSDVSRWRRLRRVIRYVFQNPDAMLHPRMTNGQIIEDALQSGNSHAGRAGRVDSLEEIQEMFLLSSAWFSRRPSELSLGQRRRVALARSLANRPRYVLLDEPFSGLDQLSKRLLWRSIRNLVKSHGTAILLISHDLESVFALCGRLLIMRDGALVEDLSCNTDGRWEPAHSYTRRLFELS